MHTAPVAVELMLPDVVAAGDMLALVVVVTDEVTVGVGVSVCELLGVEVVLPLAVPLTVGDSVAVGDHDGVLVDMLVSLALEDAVAVTVAVIDDVPDVLQTT